ncbi:uncharacterized protein AAG666_011364 isoform 2-T3 [Megaptera novaeangliae]
MSFQFKPNGLTIRGADGVNPSPRAGEAFRRRGQGGCRSPPSPALQGQRPMGDGRAREQGQWEPAGGGALPFKERRGAASGNPAPGVAQRPGVAPPCPCRNQQSRL